MTDIDLEHRNAPRGGEPKVDKLPSTFLIFRYGRFPSAGAMLAFHKRLAEACVRSAAEGPGGGRVPIVRNPTATSAPRDAEPELGWARLEARDDGLYAIDAVWRPDAPMETLKLFPSAALILSGNSSHDEPFGAFLTEVFLTDEPATHGGVKVSAALKDADWLEAQRAESCAQLASCGWGKAIEDAHRLRAAPTLPDGWTRVFDSHWACGPYYLYYAPGTSHDGLDPENHPDRAAVEVCPGGVSFGFINHESPVAMARVTALAAIDGAWLEAWEDSHPDHECGRPWVPGPKPEGYLTVAPWWIRERFPVLEPHDDATFLEPEREAVRHDAEACLAEHPGSIVVLPPLRARKSEVSEFLDAIQSLLPDDHEPMTSFAVYIQRRNRPLLRLQITQVDVE